MFSLCCNLFQVWFWINLSVQSRQKEEQLFSVVLQISREDGVLAAQQLLVFLVQQV